MSGSAEIIPFDLYRMFIGDLPLLFTLEVVFRTVFLYLYTVLILRFVSHRAVGQLSLVEFLIVIALGSAVGDPMFYPEVPLIHGMIVVTTITLFSRGLTYWMNYHEPLETFVEGVPIEVVHEGHIQSKKLREVHVSLEELFEWLRTKDVSSLGNVQYAYVEKSGRFSVFLFDKEQRRSGLAIVPPWDIDPPTFFEAGDILSETLSLGCYACGEVCEFASGTPISLCPHCQEAKWVDAVTIYHPDLVS